MSLHAKAHLEAETEFTTAIEWYAERDYAVAVRFNEALVRTIDTILTWPESGEAWEPNATHLQVRSLRVKYETFNFPYRLYYLQNDKNVFLVALAHTARMPGYWINRLEKP